MSLFTVEIEQFTDCYYVKFQKVFQARKAKATVDRKNFYGGMMIIKKFKSILTDFFLLALKYWLTIFFKYISSLHISKVFFMCPMHQSMKPLPIYEKSLRVEDEMYNIAWGWIKKLNLVKISVFLMTRTMNRMQNTERYESELNKKKFKNCTQFIRRKKKEKKTVHVTKSYSLCNPF